jgi:hypothetical protein
MKKRTPKTREEAEQYAIDWQNWAWDKSLSYRELAEWGDIFTELGERFNLTEDFKENGII